MGHEQPGSNRPGNEPESGQRMTCNAGGVALHTFFPAHEIHRSGKRRQGHELGKGYAGSLGHGDGGVEGFRVVAGQPKNK